MSVTTFLGVARHLLRSDYWRMKSFISAMNGAPIMRLYVRFLIRSGSLLLVAVLAVRSQEEWLPYANVKIKDALFFMASS